MASARLDKWLWAVRIFKARTIAAAACRNGRVLVNGSYAKAAHTVNEGDKVSVRKPPVLYTFLVLKAITQRVGASKLTGIIKNITTKDQLEILELRRIGNNGIRDRGTGRPTKKERREIDGFMQDSGYDAYGEDLSADNESANGSDLFDDDGYDSIFDEI